MPTFWAGLGHGESTEKCSFRSFQVSKGKSQCRWNTMVLWFGRRHFRFSNNFTGFNKKNSLSVFHYCLHAFKFQAKISLVDIQIGAEILANQRSIGETCCENLALSVLFFFKSRHDLAKLNNIWLNSKLKAKNDETKFSVKSRVVKIGGKSQNPQTAKDKF